MIKWLASILGGIFSLKSFGTGIMMLVLGIILYNLAVEFIQEALNFVVTKINGTSYGSVTSPSFSGFAGWVIAQLKIPECVAIIISCVSIRFILTKIPFLRW